jgi:cytochrome P450
VQTKGIYFITWYATARNILVSSSHITRLQSGEELPEIERPSPAQVAEEGKLAILAGSAPVSIVLTAMLYYLLCNPVAYERLQAEVDNAFPNGEEPLDATKLSQMEWLNGCM